MKIENLERSSKNVDIIAKVISETEVREVTSRKDISMHKVCEALIGDETGCINLVLGDDTIEKVVNGMIIMVKNAYIKIYRK